MRGITGIRIIVTAVTMTIAVMRIVVTAIRDIGQPTRGMDNHRNRWVTLVIKAVPGGAYGAPSQGGQYRSAQPQEMNNQKYEPARSGGGMGGGGYRPIAPAAGGAGQRGGSYATPPRGGSYGTPAQGGSYGLRPREAFMASLRKVAAMALRSRAVATGLRPRVVILLHRLATDPAMVHPPMGRHRRDINRLYGAENPASRAGFFRLCSGRGFIALVTIRPLKLWTLVISCSF